jgi:hypothetical protein
MVLLWVYFLYSYLVLIYLMWDKRRGRDGTGGETEDTGEEEGERRGEGGNEDRDLTIIF